MSHFELSECVKMMYMQIDRGEFELSHLQQQDSVTPAEK